MVKKMKRNKEKIEIKNVFLKVETEPRWVKGSIFIRPFNIKTIEPKKLKLLPIEKFLLKEMKEFKKKEFLEFRDLLRKAKH